MNRKGDFKIVVGIIALLFVLSLVMIINSEFFQKTSNDLGTFQGCGGFLGTLGGQKGACGTNSECTEIVKKDGSTVAVSGAKAEGGFYWSNVGQGILGCSESQYCCIQMPAGKNPPTASDVAAGVKDAAASTCALAQGQWGLVFYDSAGAKSECIKITDGGSYKKDKDSKFSVVYLPVKGATEKCLFSYSATKTGTFSTLASYTCDAKADGTGLELFRPYYVSGSEQPSFGITGSGDAVFFRLQRMAGSVPQGSAVTFALVYR